MKISNWTRLDWVSHYQQPRGCHPSPRPIPTYCERIELVTSGHGWIDHEGGWREVMSGDLIWNAPGDMTIGRSDFENPYQCLVVTLVAKRKLGTGMPRFSRWPDREEVQAFARESVRIFLDEDFDHQALFEHIVGELLFRVKLHAHEAGKDELPLPLQAVLRKMESDYASSCRLEELAGIAGWSVAHLHEVFREQMQTSPHRMLIRLRLRAAREALSSTNAPVKQIAFDCGFSDPAAFSHAFKGGTGMTPGAYRERSLRPSHSPR